MNVQITRHKPHPSTGSEISILIPPHGTRYTPIAQSFTQEEFLDLLQAMLVFEETEIDGRLNEVQDDVSEATEAINVGS